jgi:hypothetical protein
MATKHRQLCPHPNGRYVLRYILAGHKYWTRLWIVQEMILAKQIRVWYNEIIVDWQNLTDEGSGAFIDEISGIVDGIESHRAGTLSLMTAVRRWSQNACEDPRDKVYGLQAMLCESERLPIDYSKSIQEVLIDAIVILCAAIDQRTGQSQSQRSALRRVWACIVARARGGAFPRHLHKGTNPEIKESGL